MTKELVNQVRRELYDISTTALTKSDNPAEFYQWRGMSMAYLKLLEYLGTAEDEIIRPFRPDEEEES